MNTQATTRAIILVIIQVTMIARAMIVDHILQAPTPGYQICCQEGRGDQMKTIKTTSCSRMKKSCAKTRSYFNL